ncbi:MAG TPA: prephenate dehydrogenase [Clostridiaceae bacterium]|nr:prephenate dehydrogenase [Clostridiaceae bacterium]
MVNSKITIIGLGLIGGSLAKALRERLGVSDITAIEKDSGTIDKAVKDGSISRGFTAPNEHVWNSDIIFLCTPVKQTIEYITTIYDKTSPDCIITDVGSTKGKIIECVNNLPNPPCFIGGHPMAGAEKEGYLASSSHLFENAYYILTPSKSTTEAAIDCMLQIVQGIGGIPILIDAYTHDRITGAISHVPHIIASALVNMVREMDSGDGRMQMLAAGGFRDITRIASSNPDMWENIIASNSSHIIEIMNTYINILNKFKEDMINCNSRGIYEFFDSARNYREQMPSGRVGLISPLFDIVVDVVDRPGVIGEIATILGNNNINIKNINVSNSREFEQGCLRITLPDQKSVNIAFDLLSIKGYKVYKSK